MEKVIDFIKKYAKIIFDFIKKYVILIFSFIKKIIIKIIEFIKLLFVKMINFIKSVINKIREFFKNRKNNKKQSKIKVFFIGVVAYIGSVFSHLITKKKEPKEVDINSELKKINKNILNIEKSIENETTPLVLKMYKKEVNKKINKLKNIKNINTREETQLVKENEEMLLNIKEKISVCENKLKDINYKENKKIEKETIIENDSILKENVEFKNNEITNNISKENIDKNDNIEKTSKIKDGAKKIVNNTKKGIKKVTDKVKKGALVAGTTIVGLVSNIIPKNEKTKDKKELNIKKVKKITNYEEDKKLKEEIKILNEKINKIYREIKQDDEELLNKQKEEVQELKNKYLKLTKDEKFKDLKNYKYINDIDPNHLVYHDKSIDDLIYYLDKQIKIVKEKNIEKIKKEEKKKIKELVIEENDILLAKKSIEEDIKLSLEDIKKINTEINNIPKKYKKSNLLTRLSNFFKFSINVGISLIPFGIFKNKLLATLTSGIILNNRVRSMNSIIENKDEVDFIRYENFLYSLKDKKSCLQNTNYILLDTVNQINSLETKINLLGIEDKEKEKLLIGLDEMKLDLLEENVKIETMLEEMNNINKNKIKKKYRG